MTDETFDAILAEQRDRARAALSAVLGSAQLDAIKPISGGASGASTFRVDAGGRSYLLRLEGAASPLRNPHQYQSMRIAAEAGIAPRVHYVDETSRVAVIDYIEQRPLDAFAGGRSALLQALAELLKRTQSTPPFSRFVEYPDIVTRLWAHVCRTGLFETVCSILFRPISRISAASTTGILEAWRPATTI